PDVHAAEQVDQLVVQGVGALQPVEVLVPGEQLVRALAHQHDLDVTAGQPGHEVVGHRAVDEGGVERLEHLDHLRDAVDRVRRGVDQLVVVGAEVLGDGPGGGDVAAAGHPGGEGGDGAPGGRRGAGGDGGDDARVDPAGQEDPHRDVGDQQVLDGPAEGLAQRVEHPPGRVVVRATAAEQHRGRRGWRPPGDEPAR